jgi:hypothetical protein
MYTKPSYSMMLGIRTLTRKGGCDENRSKTANTADERGTRDMPVFSANVSTLSVATAVDNNTHDNENLEAC